MSRLNKKLGVTLCIVHREKERLRGYLNWLPSTLTERCAQLIAADVSGDPNAEVHRVRRQTDKWCFKYKPVKGFEVPHYVNLTLTDDEEEDYVNRVYVTLPGRRTPCSFCQQGTYWESKCPTRAEKKARRPTTDPLCQKPEDVPHPQGICTTDKHSKRPVSKPRTPDNLAQGTKDVTIASPKETEFPTTNKRQKQRNAQTPKGKQYRQNRSPSFAVPASYAEDDSPEQRKVREHWETSIKNVFQKHRYRIKENQILKRK
jgi:hypothetical protein